MSRKWSIVLTAVLLAAAVFPMTVGAAGPQQKVGPQQTPTPCTPTAGVWNAGPAMPVPLVRSWGEYLASDNSLYVIGGRTSDAGGSDNQTIYAFNTGTSTWVTKTATLPDNQVNNMVGGTVSMGGSQVIIVVGGSAAGQTVATNRVMAYNPTLDSVTVLVSDTWPANVSGDTLPGGAAVANGKLYVFGGFTINVSMIDTIWEFDPAMPAGSRWSQQTAVLPVALGYVPATTVGGYIYILGGAIFNTSLEDSMNTYSYDPVADTINDAAIPDLPRATGETRAITMPGTEAWVLGGGRIAPNPSNEVNVYSSSTMTFTLGASMIDVRRNFPADSDPATGRAWAGGGYATAPTNLFEIYAPGVNCTPTSVQVANVEAGAAQGNEFTLWLVVVGLAALLTFTLMRRRSTVA